jgi:hypothetical protein
MAAGNGNPLHLTARQLGRLFAHLIGKADPL